MPEALSPFPFFTTSQTEIILNQGIKSDLYSAWSCGVCHMSERKIIHGGAHAFDAYPQHRFETGYDSRYDVASFAKIFVSILVLNAVTRGLASLDTAITAYVPTLRPQGRCPTIRDLLSFGVTFDLEHLVSPYTSMSADKVWREIVSARICVSGFRYSNYAPFILARMLEEIYSRSFADLVREILIVPLGLSCTTFGIEDLSQYQVVATEVVNGKLICGPQDELTRALHPRTTGVSGMFSTCGDMLKLAEFMISESAGSGECIAPDLLSQLGQNQISTGFGRPDAPDSGLGFGLLSELMRDYTMPRVAERNPWLLDGAFFRSSFTGCTFVVCPAMQSAMVLCTNYVHPVRKDRESMSRLRHAIVASTLFGELVPEAQSLFKPGASSFV